MSELLYSRIKEKICFLSGSFSAGDDEVVDTYGCYATMQNNAA